jgi:hypothetical protein
MFETTKLSPCFNGFQYLFIFIVAMVVDAVVHFFSSRKYYALKSNPQVDVFGFAPELMNYYFSLCSKGPFSVDSSQFNKYCNSWILGMLIAGGMAVIMLALTDTILYIIEYKSGE